MHPGTALRHRRPVRLPSGRALRCRSDSLGWRRGVGIAPTGNGWRILLPRLGELGFDLVVASRSSIEWRKSTHRTHVGDELPHLIVGDATTKGRHAVGPALDDGGEDVLGCAAVDPDVVHQGGTLSAAAIGVAAVAIE